MGRRRAVRTPKARRNEVLSCGHLAFRGEQIVKVLGGQWVCMDCHLGRPRVRQAPGGRAW